MKELVKNHQYHVAVESLEEIDTLVRLLKDRGYHIHHNLENVLSFKSLPVGLCIDNGFKESHNGGKCLFQSNVTCMAMYCVNTKRKPLYVKEVIKYIDKLIDELDIVFYNELLDKVNNEVDRPSGMMLYLDNNKKEIN